jgi:hypothetical protein
MGSSGARRVTHVPRCRRVAQRMAADDLGHSASLETPLWHIYCSVHLSKR